MRSEVPSAITSTIFGSAAAFATSHWMLVGRVVRPLDDGGDHLAGVAILRGAEREGHPPVLAELGGDVHHQHVAEQLEVLLLLRRRRGAPEAAEAEARHAVDIDIGIDDAAEHLAPLLERSRSR